MLYVEDALKLISDRYWKSNFFSGLLDTLWYKSFIENVSKHVLIQRKPLTTGQSEIVLKLVAKVKHKLIFYGDASEADLDELIRNPQHRQAPTPSADIRKEVRYLGANFLGVRFKFNDLIMQDIRAMSYVLTAGSPPWFDRDHRIWVIPVTQKNLTYIRDMIRCHRFELDAAAKEYLALAEESNKTPSTLVYDDQSRSFVLNVCDDDMLAAWVKSAGGIWI